jgi:hypothetical protein
VPFATTQVIWSSQMRTEVLEALAAQRAGTTAVTSPDGGFAFASLQVSCCPVFCLAHGAAIATVPPAGALN